MNKNVMDKNELLDAIVRLYYKLHLNERVVNHSNKNNMETDGKWVKYDQGSDYHILRNSLQGYHTGWCTATEERFAKGQLKWGDFYVYYSIDENGEYKIPRIAIRMNGHNIIGEIRGIADNLNMEPEMIPILSKKLEDEKFPNRCDYYKKEYDVLYLTEIDKKVNNNIELSREELEFLYEINGKIDGFGYRRDPRIKEIKEKRNLYKDYAKIFNCREDEVGPQSNNDDYTKYKVWLHRLSFYNLTTVEELIFPKYVLPEPKYVLPEYVMGDLDFRNLKNAEGLTLPKYVGGKLNLDSLRTAEGVTFPEYVGGELDLSNLKNAKGVTLPKYVGGKLDLGGLRTAEEVTFPEYVGNNLYLEYLETAKRLTFPKYVGYDFYLQRLERAKKVTFPEYVGNNLYLDNLYTVEEVTWPKYVKGDLKLWVLQIAKELTFPEYVGGSLILRNLISKELNELNLPKYVGRDLEIRRLTTLPEKITFPEYVGGDLDLHKLTNAEGVTLPKYVGGKLDLPDLETVKGLTFPKYVGEDLILASIATIEGITSPKDLRNAFVKEIIDLDINVGGEIYISNAGGEWRGEWRWYYVSDYSVRLTQEEFNKLKEEKNRHNRHKSKRRY